METHENIEEQAYNYEEHDIVENQLIEQSKEFLQSFIFFFFSKCFMFLLYFFCDTCCKFLVLYILLLY
jgi:hypothetical protein